MPKMRRDDIKPFDIRHKNMIEIAKLDWKKRELTGRMRRTRELASYFLLVLVCFFRCYILCHYRLGVKIISRN